MDLGFGSCQLRIGEIIRENKRITLTIIRICRINNTQYYDGWENEHFQSLLFDQKNTVTGEATVLRIVEIV